MNDSAPLHVIHRPWPSPTARPAMSNEVDRHRRIALTDRWIEVDGRPAVPVSGELHFSRVPRREWAERLRLLRSGGVTIVSTYLFWIHHQPSRDAPPRFDDGLDVGAFVDLAAESGLDVVVRIGPWCHGEVRNGGFPDWVQAAPVRHRSDDPGYLELAADWYAAVGAELASRCGPDAPIVGIQLENELIDQPGHLVTLKRLAREAGLSAPLWTATAWDGAELPPDDVLPLYGGYGDGFWSDADAPWAPGFRAQFRFSHEWDDPGIGADVRGTSAGPRPPRPRRRRSERVAGGTRWPCRRRARRSPRGTGCRAAAAAEDRRTCPGRRRRCRGRPTRARTGTAPGNRAATAHPHRTRSHRRTRRTRAGPRRPAARRRPRRSPSRGAPTGRPRGRGASG